MNHRVLQLVLSLNPGGTERLVVEIVKGLGREVPMAVCCLDDVGIWAEELRSEDVPVIGLRRARGFRPSLAMAIAGAARQHRATVIHCHHYSPFVYGSLARLWSPNLRVVFTEHGRLSDQRPSRKRRYANLLLSRLPREVYAVSEDLKRHLVAEGFPFAAVGVIYNGITVGSAPDASARQHARRVLGVPPETVVIGTIGRLDPVKDFGMLIRAIPALAEKMRTTLLLIGSGSERPALEALAAERGVAHCVRFLGHRDDARDLLPACDVYVNSSVSEGVSLTILEAMAAQLPIVATSVGGTPEVLDSTCGRLVPARDFEALGRALLELTLQPAVRRELGLAARRRVESRFTLARMVSAYRDVYMRVA